MKATETIRELKENLKYEYPLAEFSQDYIWYFAIGSMMNKVSLNSRGIFPVESRPAEILDYDLVFFGGAGMAVAEAKKGKSFHGVLHKVTQKEMEVLDGIERVYQRVPSKARLYDGTIQDCTVYADPAGLLDRKNDKPPTARYI